MKTILFCFIIALGYANAYFGLTGCGCEPTVSDCATACFTLDISFVNHFTAESSGNVTAFQATLTDDIIYHFDTGYFGRGKQQVGALLIPILENQPQTILSQVKIDGYVSQWDSVNLKANGSIAFFLKGHANFTSPWPVIFFGAKPNNNYAPIKYQVDMAIRNNLVASEEIFLRPDELILAFKIKDPSCFYKKYLKDYGMQNPLVADAWFNPQTTTYVGPTLFPQEYKPQNCY